MDITSFKRDAAGIDAGQWVGDIPNTGDLRLRVRGFTSPTVVAVRSRKERAVERKDRRRDGGLKPEAAMRVLSETLCEVVLLDWDGITDGGKPVPYSKDLAKKWLSDPNMQPFADAVSWAAMVVDNGEAAKAEEIAGN
jgi:hypothetical protein